MRNRGRLAIALWSVVVTTLTAADPAPKPAAEDTRGAELFGEWTLVRHVEPDGTVTRHREESVGNSHFLLRFGRGAVVQEYDFGDPSLEITWAAMPDPSATPKRIDLAGAEASSSKVTAELKGAVRRGIYRFDRDRLTLCLATSDAEARPTSFEPGRGREVFELKRVK